MPEARLADDPLLSGVPEREGYKVLGGVVLYQKLGQGGMGAVYRGKHLRLEVDVALKIMATPAGLHPDQAANYLQRFLREAKTSASVKHQNLIRVYDVNSEGDVHFLIMDFVDGESAGDRLKRKGRLSEQEAAEICLGAAEGLAAAHESGVVHRDVKPDNILIDKKGNTVVADLGLAKAFGGESDSALSMGLSLTQQAMGTPYYMAPEQTRSAKDVGPQADVWSLGVTLYQLASGRLPWSETDITDLISGIRHNPAPGVKTHCAELSDGLCAIIEKAMEKEPAERYSDCAEMAAALTDHLDAIGTSRKSVLPDPEAGQTKMALVTLTPPPSKTLTLIGKSFLAPSPARMPAQQAAVTRPTLSPMTPTAARVGFPGWAMAVAGAGVVLLALVLWAVLRRGGADPVPKAGSLEADAAALYEAQLEAMTAEGFAEVVAAIDATENRYRKTTYGLRIAELRQKAEAKLAEKHAREEEARKRAAFEAAVAAARKAEEAGDLEEAARQLSAALEAVDDAATREKLSELERKLRFQRSVARGEQHEKNGEWQDALGAYQKALEIATEAEKPDVEVRLARVTRRIELEKTVAAARRETESGSWLKAWDIVQGARKGGLADPRLAELSRRAVEQLVPPKTLPGPLGLDFVLVPGGTFAMGSDQGSKSEKPVHDVTVSSFYIGRCEVTRARYEVFRSGRRAAPKVVTRDGRKPAVDVSWDDAVAFCKYLAEIDPSGAAYRLPTEAEWECAARGAQGRTYPWGVDASSARHANFAGEADGHDGLAPVGSFPKGATPLGVMDMAGNAAEWCSDRYGLYRAKPQKDPTGPVRGRARVVRGGAYVFDKTWARAAARAGREPDDPSDCIGFRVVRDLTATEKKFHELAGLRPAKWAPAAQGGGGHE